MKPIGISVGIGSHQRGSNVQRAENNPPSQSPGAYSYLSMNGTSDKLVTPSITFDEIEIDFKAKIMNSGSIRYYFDARTSASMCFYSSGDTGPENFAGTTMTKNGVAVTSGTEFANTSSEERATYILKGTSQTSIVHFGVRYTLIQFAKMDIYSIKLRNAGVVVTHYDMTKGNVQDQTGNGNHATLTGGTWV